MADNYVFLKNFGGEVINPRTELGAIDMTTVNGIVVSANTIGIMDGYIESSYYMNMVSSTDAANHDSAYIDGGTMFQLIGGSTVTAVGAPVIFANRIQASSPGTPGKTKSYITQASTANPQIIFAVYDSSTTTWSWDTGHPVDVSSIYGDSWYDALYIETDTGRLWTVSSSDSRLQPVTMGTYTRLIIMTETFYGSGWEDAVTGGDAAPTPVANGSCLIMSSSTSGGVTTITPLWCLAVSDGQGGYTWDTQHPVSAESDLSSSYIYYATATGKLYMYVDGNSSLTCIARPGSGGGSINVSFENVTGLSNTTYPDPVGWGSQS